MQINKIDIKEENSGVSLIEIIVIVAILGILAVSSVATFSLINKGDIKKDVKIIETSINKTRQNAMAIAIKEWSFSISKELNKAYMVSVKKVVVEGASEVISSDDSELNKNTKITFKDELGLATQINDADILKVTFSPSTGSVKDILLNGTSVKGVNSSFAEITINLGDKSEVLTLYYISGKVQK